MAVRVKREPGSNGTSAADGSGGTPQRICFVCGGNKAAYPLSSRPRERGGSYFPFLEQHDIPHGARRPNAEGDVAACMLCHSFLNQQWEMYEKNRTPHAKRLYWLKRADNGHYIGADMSQQGDYASQVIGVSPEPGAGGQHGHCSSAQPVPRPARGSSSSSHHHNNRGGSTPHLPEEYYGRSDANAPYPAAAGAPADTEDGYGSPAMLLDLRGGKEQSGGRTPGASPRSSSSSSKCREPTGEQGHRKPEFPFAHSTPNGALDLSMPDKNAVTEACYLCGDEVLRSTLVNAYAKPVSNCPFFPSLMLHPRPSRSRPMDSNGCVQACKPCYQYLLQQWDIFQRQSVPHSERRYQLWKHGGGGSAAAAAASRPPRQPSPRSPQLPPLPPPQQPPHDFVCFLCGREFPWNLRHILYAGTNPEGEPPLPFLERVKPARGSMPLSAAGQALACSECYRAVHRQRHAYMDSLRSALLEEAPPPQRPQGSHHHKAAREYEPPTPAHHRDASCLTCHLCRQTVPRQHLKFAEALPDKDAGQGFYPASVQDDGDGFPVCLQCYGALLAQWDAFEEDRIPYHQRRYVVPQQHPPSEPPCRKVSTASRPGSEGGLHHEMALRIRVPSPEQDHVGSHGGGAPLLTTVSTTSDSPASLASTARGNPLDLSSGPLGRGAPRPGVSSSPMALSKATAPMTGVVAAVCYICGLHVQGSRSYTVRAFLQKQEGADPAPFFPFLTLHQAPPEAEPLAEDGAALACTFCYHSLMVQWTTYEAASAGPWARAYNCHDYVCYVCGVTTYRKRVKAISVADFPFLVQHPRPPGSLVLDGGDGVVVCLMCYETLSSQWNDFERMKVPLELRKYNWIAAPPPPEEDEPPPTITGAPLVNGESPSDYQKPIVIDDDDDDDDDDDGEDINLPAPGRRISRQETPPQQQMPGLVHGGGSGSGKPPPLTPSVPQANCSQKQMGRGHSVAAAAPPLSQMSPNGAAAAVGGSQARTSSFAAALRKLAEQAIEPCDKDMPPLSPIDSPCSTPTLKRVPPSLVHSNAPHPSSAHSHPAPSNFSSPPVVSAAAPVPAHGGFVDGRKGHDRLASGQSRDMIKGSYEDARKSSCHTNHRPHAEMSRDDGSSAGRGSSVQPYVDGRRDADLSPAKGFLAASQAVEGMGTKGGGTLSGYYVDGGRDEHAFVANGLATSQQLQHMRSRQSSAGGSLPRLENPAPSHLPAAGGGFHPYRSPSEDARHGLPQHVPPAYEQNSPYGYHHATFLPHHMSHPSFRLDDQLYLERYGLLRSPLFPMPHPGLPTHHSMPFMASARYPPELLPHHLGLVSSTGHLLAQERIKLEEQQQQQQQQRREIEMEIYHEQERRREREREREKEREWERESAGEALMLGRSQQQDGKGYQKAASSSWSHARRSESPVRPGVIGSITQGTPRDLVIHSSSASHQQPSCSPGPTMAKPPSAAPGPPPWNSAHYFPYAAAREPHLEIGESHHSTGGENIANKLYPPVSHLHDRSSPASERDRPPRDPGGTRAAHEIADRSSSSFSTTSRPSSLLSFLPHSQKLRTSSPTTSLQYPHHAATEAPDRTGGGGGKPIAADSVGRRVSVITSEAPSAGAVTAHNGAVPAPAHHEMIFSREPRLPKTGVVAAGRNHSAAAASTTTHITVDVEDGGNNVSWCPRFSPSLSAPALLPVDGFAAAVPQECRPMASVVSNGLKSKLDLAAERARLRSGDEASEDEDAADEGRWSRLLVIASGPPLPLDESKEKVAFFAYFGLTTQKKKREMELDKIVRRQKRLRDPTLPSLEGIPGYRTYSTLWFLPHSSSVDRCSSEDPCRESDKPEKVQFLRNLDLNPMPRTKREEHEQILRAVIEEKIKRNGHSHPRRYKSVRSFRNDDRRLPGSSHSEFENLVKKCAKRKCNANEIPSTSGEREPTKRAKSLLANSRKKIANLPARRPSDASAGQSLLPIVSGPIIKRAREQSEFNALVANSKAMRMDDPAASNADQLQLYGRDFAQEFHESVLLQTQLKSRAAAGKKGDWQPPDKTTAAEVCGPSEVHASSSSHSSGHVPHRTHHFQLRWPGIEVLMEAYERHEQEQTLEKEVLSEQCLRLKTQNRELNKVVEKFTQNMANLIHIKKGLDEERHCHHRAIDNLKHILKRLR